MLLGDFGDYRNESPTPKSPDTWLDESHNLSFMILFIFTLVMVIVMLNLLIAIISDSFEKVMALEQQSENYEKLHLILENEALRGKNFLDSYEKENKGLYIHFMSTNEGEEEEENNEERMRAKIDKIQKFLEDFKRKTKKN